MKDLSQTKLSGAKTGAPFTLGSAFKGWSMLRENITLAAKSRDAVQKVLLRKYSDMELSKINFATARNMLCHNDELQETRTKAASILVHVLRYYAEEGLCFYPNFDYDIVDPEYPLALPDNPVEVTVKPEALARRQNQLAEKPQQSNMDRHETQAPSGEKKRICQIDPKTGETVATYTTISQAHAKTGINNIYRCLSSNGTAGGYRWRKEDMDNQPLHSDMSKMENPAPQQKENPAPTEGIDMELQHQEDAAKKSLQQFSDFELLDEIRRRGWKGNITFTVSAKL